MGGHVQVTIIVFLGINFLLFPPVLTYNFIILPLVYYENNPP